MIIINKSRREINSESNLKKILNQTEQYTITMSTFTIPLLILNTIIISVNLLVVAAVIYLVFSFARSLIQMIIHHSRGHFIRPSQLVNLL